MKTVGLAEACVKLDNYRYDHICANSNIEQLSSQGMQWEGISANKAGLTLDKQEKLS